MAWRLAGFTVLAFLEFWVIRLQCWRAGLEPGSLSHGCSETCRNPWLKKRSIRVLRGFLSDLWGLRRRNTIKRCGMRMVEIWSVRRCTNAAVVVAAPVVVKMTLVVAIIELLIMVTDYQFS